MIVIVMMKIGITADLKTMKIYFYFLLKLGCLY